MELSAGANSADPAVQAWTCIADLWLHDGEAQLNDACAAVQLSPARLRALISLNPGDQQTMRGLATRWRCDPSIVTGIVDALEERRFVVRRAHPEDRRVRLVGLTELGVQARETARTRLYRAPKGVASLADTDKQRLASLLAVVMEAQ